MVFLLLLWSGQPGLAQTNWWNPSWNYRIPITVEPANTEQYNCLVAATINFSVALKASRARGIFVSNTIRLIEVSTNGQVLDEAVYRLIQM